MEEKDNIAVVVDVSDDDFNDDFEEEKEEDENCSGIGGTDITAIAGFSKYSSAFKIWKRLVQPKTPKSSTTPRMSPRKWGVLLEPLILQSYATITGKYVSRLPLLRHSIETWAVGKPDGEVKDECIVEAKLTRQGRGWGVPGEKYAVPVDCNIQGQWYCWLRNLSRIDFAVFFIDKLDLRIYSVFRDDTLIQTLIELGRKFWFDHVKKQLPPNGFNDVSIINEWYNKTYPPPLSIDSLAIQLCIEHQKLLDVKRKKEAIELTIERIMKSAKTTEIATAVGIIKLREQVPYRTDWKTIAITMEPTKDLIENNTHPNYFKSNIIVPSSWNDIKYQEPDNIELNIIGKQKKQEEPRRWTSVIPRQELAQSVQHITSDLNDASTLYRNWLHDNGIAWEERTQEFYLEFLKEVIEKRRKEEQKGEQK